jgi:signal transduction histidine kinase
MNRLDLQSRIILVLTLVIVPTFLVMTIVQNKVTQPILEQEMKQIGIATAESLELKILSNQWLSKPSFYPLIESEIQELVYLQPSIFRIEVFSHIAGDTWRLVASNIEYEPGPLFTTAPVQESSTTVLQAGDNNSSYWMIDVPIKSHIVKQAKNANRVIGKIQLRVSTRTVHRVLGTFWKVTGIGAIVSVFILIIVLNFFLRRAVMNERLLRMAESQNIQLVQQLHEVQREVMNKEKLAVMGQLTANFAHEIGTPLNAIGGHLQLMEEELGASSKKRLGIISGEVHRIENIVKGFLQTTSKPDSQRQLVDLNSLIEKSLSIVGPRLDNLAVQVKTDLNRKLGPMRVVPTDIEQIFLNLLNNSADSLQVKRKQSQTTPLSLKVTTDTKRDEGKEWIELAVYDTGVGIKKTDLKNITKPFFTTKRPGEGTGLGLTICNQLAAKYGGILNIDSKDGSWAEVRIRFPYVVNG